MAICSGGMDIAIGRRNGLMPADVARQRGSAAVIDGAEHGMPEDMKPRSELRLLLTGRHGLPQCFSIQSSARRGKKQRFLRRSGTALLQIAGDVRVDEIGHLDIFPMPALALTIDASLANLLRVREIQLATSVARIAEPRNSAMIARSRASFM